MISSDLVSLFVADVGRLVTISFCVGMAVGAGVVSLIWLVF